MRKKNRLKIFNFRKKGKKKKGDFYSTSTLIIAFSFLSGVDKNKKKIIRNSWEKGAM